jgi:hypothetical protein
MREATSRPAPAAHVLVGVLALALACPGCSFIFVSGPPANVEKLSPTKPIRCTTSRAAPALDAVITGFEVVRTLIALGASDATYANAPISRTADIGLGLALSGLFAVSMGYGFATTSDCANAEAWQYRARQEESSSPSTRRETSKPVAPATVSASPAATPSPATAPDPTSAPAPPASATAAPVTEPPFR